jgi:hypothetical protein
VFDAVFQGIVTGADPVFLSTDWEPYPSDTALLRFFSEAEEKYVDIEREITVPVVRRQGFDSYLAVPRQRLILPYDKSSEALLSARKIADLFPLAWEYLLRHHRTLTARENGRFTNEWWSLSRAQNIARWSGAKILVPYMIDRLQAVYDESGAFFVNVTTGGYGLPLLTGNALGKPCALYFVGLLNSTLLDFCMRRISNHFHGGYYPANKQYLQHLPLKLPETADERKLAARITDAVREIIDSKTRLRAPDLSDRERGSLQRQVESLETRIDESVFRLYGVEGLPQ